MRTSLAVCCAAVFAQLAAAAPPRIGLPGGILAVETLAGIQLIDASGRDRRLPGTSRGDQNPRWSPDGRWLVFTAFAGLNADRYTLAGLMAVHPDGTGLHRIPTLSPQAYQPSWSPDGKSIAYDSIAGGKGEIAVTAVNGRGPG